MSTDLNFTDLGFKKIINTNKDNIETKINEFTSKESEVAFYVHITSCF